MKFSSNSLKIIILSVLIFTISCGKKAKNPYGYGYGFNYLPQNTQANIAAYLTQYQCPNGRIPEITFSVNQFYQGSGNTTQIQGSLSASPIGGIPSNSYVGVNYQTKDVMVVTKVTSGGRVVGFNVSLSLCRDIRQVNSGYGVVNIPIIDNSRMPGIYQSNPIIVTDPTSCPMGTVDQAYVRLILPAYRVPNTNVTYAQTYLDVSFTRAPCIQ